jgi:hypothetical protein
MKKRRKYKKYDEKLFIDMPFGEALERFAGVDPKEMHANIAKTKRKRSSGGKPPDNPVDQKVVRLRDRRKAHNFR